MYYLKIIRRPLKKGEGDKNTLKGIKLPISKKTFDILFLCRFDWWNPDLSSDIKNDRVVNRIEDDFSDVFYMIINEIIEDKTGMVANVDFEYEDVDSTENEIEIFIEMIK